MISVDPVKYHYVILMHPGKRSSLDPRVAPGKAPANAPDTSDKPMPEYTMNKSELVYPGEGEPFSSKAPAGTPRRQLPHSATPQTGTPRNKIHLAPIALTTWMEELEHCIAACERSADPTLLGGNALKPGLCVTMSRACADICTLLHCYLKKAEVEEVAHLAIDLAPVCARACEACALVCGQHPDVEPCTSSAKACRSCAAECRQAARI